MNDRVKNCIRSTSEVREYLCKAKVLMQEEELKVTKLVTAVMLPTGGIEIAVNSEFLFEKIQYILDTYDEQMRHKNNPAIVMVEAFVI